MEKNTLSAQTDYSDFAAAKSARGHSQTVVGLARKSRALIASGGFDIFAIWLLLTAVNLSFHHLIPLDETRYAAVAWEMRLRHNFLVPYLNGIPYHHKPPLLFWLYNAGWSLFGVGELWLLLVSPLCGLAGLYWVRYLAALLWPGNQDAIRMAPWLLIGSLIWGAFMNGAMFDMLLGLCVLLAMTGLIRAASTLRWRDWALYALGCGMGLLTKGPAIFVYILMPFLFGRFWGSTARTNAGRWYLRGSLALLIGIVMALCWVIPAVRKAGDAYGVTLLWHQTVDRMITSFAHRRPFWWYFMWSPVILFPWFFWPRLWRRLFKRVWLTDLSFRFCLLWFGGGIIGFSLISGKQIHYLLPLMPALALLLSRVLMPAAPKFRISDALPYLIICLFGALLLMLPDIPGLKLYHWIQNRQGWWGWSILAIGFSGIALALKTQRIAARQYAIAVVLVLASSLAGFFSSQGNAYNLRPAAGKLSAYLKANEPLVWAGQYDGQFEFLMRLQAPLPVISIADISTWLDHNPKGHVISIIESWSDYSGRFKIDYVQPYREEWLVLLSRINDS